MRTVLVVEDDAAIRSGVVLALRSAGFAVAEAAEAVAARQRMLHGGWDLCLLDLVLPGGDGLDLLAELKRVRPEAPVVILTARGDERDRVRGLELGADDYVVKPFSVAELLARCRAVLRRASGASAPTAALRLRDGEVDLERRAVRFRDGGRAELGAREAAALAYLARHAGRAVPRDELLARLYGIDGGADSRCLDMLVLRLRAKLRDEAAAVLQTVRGIGYQLAADAVATPAATTP